MLTELVDYAAIFLPILLFKNLQGGFSLTAQSEPCFFSTFLFADLK